MSTASVTNLHSAAAIASAVAAQLAANPGAPMTAGAAAAILQTAVAAAGVANPNIGLGLALASIGLNAIHVAVTTGAGLTPEQWSQIKDEHAAAIAADLAAHPKA